MKAGQSESFPSIPRARLHEPLTYSLNFPPHNQLINPDYAHAGAEKLLRINLGLGFFGFSSLASGAASIDPEREGRNEKKRTIGIERNRLHGA